MPNENSTPTLRPLKAFTAGLGTESNTFHGTTLGWADFEAAFLYRPGDHPAALTEVSAPLHVLREHRDAEGWQLVEGTFAFAMPGGRVERRVYESLRDEILGQLATALPVDLVALSLHGAMCAEGYDDCEGDLLKRVRELVGPAVPVGAELDLHAHLTDAMVDSADVLVAFKEYPHTDFLERARELVDLLERCVRHGWRPAKAVYDCRTIARFHTTADPARGLVRRMAEAEQVPGVASVSLIHGFPFGDVADLGTKALAYADTAALAESTAAWIGELAIAVRGHAAMPSLPIDAAIDWALARAGGPVVVADVDDNPGSGATGGDCSFLSRLLARPAVRACLGPLYDPQVVSAAMAAGLHGRCRMTLRGIDIAASLAGTDVEFEVSGLSREATQTWSGTQMSLGAACALRAGSVTVVVTSVRDQAYGPDLFTGLSVDLLAQQLVVVKSAQHFMAGFKPIAAATMLATGGGPLLSDFRSLAYEKARRPLWPLDQDVPRRTLWSWVEHWATVGPEAEAAVGPAQRLSWRDLKQSAEDFARSLIAVGVQPGDRVAMLTTPGPQFLTCFLATAAIGGIWVGLNPRYTRQELDSVLAKVTPRVLVSETAIEGRDYSDWLAHHAATIVTVALGDGEPAPEGVFSQTDFLNAGFATPATELGARITSTLPGYACLIVFTSGSSGPPKGAVICQAALTGASEVQVTEWRVEPLRVLNNLPISHIGCVGDLACYTLVGGGTSIFTPRFDAEATLRLLREERVSVLGQVPTMFRLLLDAPSFDPQALVSVRLIFWGGAHADRKLITRLQSLCPWVATSYGQTETAGSVTFTVRDASSETLSRTVGRPVAPYLVRIAPLRGDEPGDHAGEVEVRTPFGFSGYWRDPTATARVTTDDGWHRTGDLGLLTESGDLRLVGRVHNVFKSGGYNVSPPEVESALQALPDVVDACVIGIPDPVWGHVPAAFVVASDPRLTAADIDRELRRTLANYKVPRRYVFLNELPRLSSGKIDKRSLAQRFVSP